MHALHPRLLLILLGCLSAIPAAAEETPQKPLASAVRFDRDIRPLFSNHCYQCHGPDAGTREADFRLDTHAGASAELSGGGRAIVPGNLEESELYRRLTTDNADERMPPAESGKPLSPAQIELIGRWIKAGAEWDEHWAFRPVARATPPGVKQPAWVKNPIDAFVLARLETEGLAPSPVADRRTLIRRLSFDLLGLPPSREEVAAFVADERPDSYEQLVDRLLASPHYGERLAMYWLDLVRYADTVGYHGDQNQNISRYRDWVITALNENRPFDEFTIAQLAGDLLPEATLEDRVASGYNRLNLTTEEGGAQPKEYLAKYSADRVRNFSAVWLGSTLGCAECHDHKFDPFTSKDFYRIAAFFADIQEVGKYSGQDGRPPEIKAATPQEAAELARLDEAIAALTAKITAVPAEAGALQAQLDELAQQKAMVEKKVRATLVTVAVEPRPIRVLARGNWMDTTGEEVMPGVPGFLPPLMLEADRRATRLDLARWLVSGEHPLTSRVFVNRLWKLYFGAGLSKVLDDVGAQGESPMHPELLDWLANEFVEHHWDIKYMVRLLVTSQTYRQSSLVTPELRERDPNNRLLARQSRYRLEAELIRDNALAVSGLLVRKIGGPSVHPYQPAGYYQHLNFPTRSYLPDRGENQYRRGLYTHWQRTFLHPALLAFDAPTREECTAERASSNTPKGALALLNDPSMIEAARVLAARYTLASETSLEQRLAEAFEVVTSRVPEPREVEVLKALYAEQFEHYQSNREAATALSQVGDSAPPENVDLAELAAWTSVARTLLNLNETITRN